MRTPQPGSAPGILISTAVALAGLVWMGAANAAGQSTSFSTDPDRRLVDAVQARDFRAVQGGVLLLATVFVLANLIADILYAWLDPRIRYDEE
jgi:predicted DCC family thiol-disulfide oxidoreductase YuxK